MEDGLREDDVGEAQIGDDGALGQLRDGETDERRQA